MNNVCLPPAIGYRLLAIGSRLLAIGSRLSAIGYRLSAISGGMIAVGLLVAAYLWVSTPLPDPAQIRARASLGNTRILDRNGTLLYALPDPLSGRQNPVPLSEIPLALQQATIAVEDASFYQNSGVDLRGIARALKWRPCRRYFRFRWAMSQFANLVAVAPAWCNSVVKRNLANSSP